MILVAKHRKKRKSAAVLVTCLLLPAHIGAAPYMADAHQNRVEFSFVQAGARNIGHFREFSINYDPPPARGTGGFLEVLIDTHSLYTRDGDRDSMLRSAYFFETDFFPEAKFESTSIQAIQDGVYEAYGILTIRDVARPLNIRFVAETDDTENESLHLHGSVTIRRLDFGVGQGEWRSTTWIRNDVTINYSVRLSPKTTFE